MANIIQIKHGSNEPTSENLTNYELGYSEYYRKIIYKCKWKYKKIWQR